MNDVTGVLAVLTLVIGVPLNFYVNLVLRRFYQETRSPVLVVLGVVWIGVTLIAIVFGLIFLNNDAPEPFLTGAETKLITRVVVLGLVTVPAVVLLWWLNRGKRPRRR